MKQKWFKAKEYGWGWYPSRWQGWFVIVCFVVFTVWNFLRLDTDSYSASDTLRPFVIETILTALLLVVVAWLTGEKPGWRWGSKK